MPQNPPPNTKVVRFSGEYAAEWESVVARSPSATFLFSRRYMDYHSDRFRDHSALVFENGEPIGIFPANQVEKRIVSHGGLTYGGLALLPSVRLTDSIRVFHALLRYYADAGAEELIYKKLPNYYLPRAYALDEYPLFLAGAELVKREPSLVAFPSSDLGMDSGRRYDIRKARDGGLCVVESTQFARFWDEILEPNLDEKFGVKPAHSAEEMVLLHGRFPENIRLFVCLEKERERVLGGAVVYVSRETVHVQYTSSNALGREIGAQLFLFDHLITSVFSGFQYFSFGTSNEPSHGNLNLGLTRWKERFNAQPFSHDTYRIDLGAGFAGLAANLE